jgi:hypothetical protein
MATSSKWSKQYWQDLIERVGSTAVSSLIGVILAVNFSGITWSWDNVWALILVPAGVSTLKALGINISISGSTPSASLVKVSSTKAGSSSSS